MTTENNQIINPTKYDLTLSIIFEKDAKSDLIKVRYGFALAKVTFDFNQAIDKLASQDHVSRAFYKIKEAFERCRIQESLQPTYNAIDIGAAPGGWSLFLSNIVKNVYAVDPAIITISKPNIIHIKSLIVNAIDKLQNISFDYAVCDMNEDPKNSIYCLKSIENQLNQGCVIILTFKYPKRGLKNLNKRIESDVKTFSDVLPSFKVLRVMHLLSNHHERTLIAKRE